MSLAIDQGRRAGPRLATVGGLPIETLGLDETTRAFIDYCLGETRRMAPRPLYSTSVNGQVISQCASDKGLARMMGEADSISADGQPLVILSKYLCRNPLPERVATTDLFPRVAVLAEQAGVSFYLLGACEDVNARAAAAVRKAYPRLAIVGHRHGYFSRDEESAICAEIAALRPDILWVSLGVPLEQRFASRNLSALRGVGIVKTAGGLLDFVAAAKPRAPRWMQKAGLEWLFRLALEPRRLFWRYAVTSPHALFVMLRTMR
jgi:exopolysaccharide biosynthesis WecB/TagA/CpsF family protein